MALDRIFESMRDFFGHVIQRLFGESGQAIAHEAAGVLQEAFVALLRNAAAAGVKDGGALLIELANINKQAQASGAPTDQKYDAFMSAGKIAWQRFGGDLEHAATMTVLDTAAGLLHQPDKAAEVSAPAP